MKKRKKSRRVMYGIIIDPSLDKYNKMPLFQDKLDEANETLRKFPPPKSFSGNKKQRKKQKH